MDWGFTKGDTVFSPLKGKTPGDLIDEQKLGYLPYVSNDYLREDRAMYAKPGPDTPLTTENDILVLWDGSNAGEVFLAKPGILSSTMALLDINNKQTFDKKYIYYSLKAKETTLQRTTKGTGVPHVDGQLLSVLPFAIPPVKEQKKISEILSSVDVTINKTQKTIDQTQTLKKGLMQALFSRGLPGRHKRFRKTEIGEIPNDWKIVRMGTVLKDLSYGMSAKCSYKESKYPVLRIPNVISGKINFNDLKYTDIDGAQAQQYKLIQNDVLLVRTNGNPNFVGRAAIVSKMKGDWLFASYLIRLRFLTENIHPVYGYYALNSPGTRKLLEKGIRTSAGNYNLNGPGIKSTPIALPSLDEQLAITSLIDTTENKVLCDVKYLAWLEHVKSSLMQVLLTGKVRVAL